MSDPAQETASPPTPPQQQGFADKVNESMGALSFFAYLFHPDQPSFDDYNGPVPTGLREKITGLAEMAKMFGLGGDIAMPSLNDIAAEMTPGKIMQILDGIDDPEQFAKIYANPQLKGMVDDIAKTILEDGDAIDITLGDALAESESSINLRVFGEDFLELSIMELDEDTIAGFSSGLSDAQTLTFLDSLPDTKKDAVLAKLGSEQNAEGNWVPLERPDGTTFSVAGLTIEQAIEDRAKFELERFNNSADFEAKDFGDAIFSLDKKAAENILSDMTGYYNRVTGKATDNLQFGLDTARVEVYETIRAAIPEGVMETIVAEKAALANPEDIAPTKLYETLKEQLADNEGRKKIQDAITANMDKIKDSIKGMEDISVLAQFLPQDIMDKQMGNTIRQVLDQMGFLQPIIALVSTALSWFQGLDLGRFNGVKEKLTSAIDVERLQQDGISQEQRLAAAGLNTDEEAKPDPAKADSNIGELTEGLDGNVTANVTHGPVPPGGKPATITSGN